MKKRKGKNPASKSHKEEVAPLSNSTRMTNPVDLQDRRFDSLARLLEGNGTCAAVCFDGNKILVASNAIHSTSRDSNQKIALINETLKYFSEIANGKHVSPNELFQAICRQYLQGQLQSTYIASYHDKAINQLAIEIFRHKNPINARNWGVSKRATKVGLNGDDLRDGQVIGAALIAISKLATDFKKLERSIKGEEPEKKFEANILEAFKQQKFLILKEGKRDVHAEMRIINYLIKQNSSQEECYVGTSKLCCLECSITVKAVNQSEVIKVGGLTVEDNCSPAIQSQFKIQIRGSHGIAIKKWQDCLPPFLDQDNQQEYQEKIYASYQEIRKQLSVSIEIDEPGHKMTASDSDSAVMETDSIASTNSGIEGTKITTEYIMSLVHRGIKVGTLTQEGIVNALLENTAVKQVADKAGNAIDIHAKYNAANQYQNQLYQYQGTDIEAIGKRLIQGKEKVVFVGALGIGRNAYGIDALARLNQDYIKDDIASDKTIVGVYNTGGNHWIALSIKLSQNKQAIEVRYKDSYGIPRQDFIETIEKAFGKGLKTQVIHIQPGQKDQTDGVSCGLYALENMVILANSDASEKYYNPKTKEELLERRMDFAVKYAEQVYTDLRHEELNWQERIKRINELAPRVETIAKQLEQDQGLATSSNQIEVRILNHNQHVGPIERANKKIISVEVRVGNDNKPFYRIGISEAVSNKDSVVKQVIKALGLQEQQVISSSNTIDIYPNLLSAFFSKNQRPVQNVSLPPEEKQAEVDQSVDKNILIKLKDVLHIKEPLKKAFGDKLNAVRELNGTYQSTEFDLDELTIKFSYIIEKVKENQDYKLIHEVGDLRNLLSEENERVLLREVTALDKKLQDVVSYTVFGSLIEYKQKNGLASFKEGAVEILKKLLNSEKIIQKLNLSSHIIDSKANTSHSDSLAGIEAASELLSTKKGTQGELMVDPLSQPISAEPRRPAKKRPFSQTELPSNTDTSRQGSQISQPPGTIVYRPTTRSQTRKLS